MRCHVTVRNPAIAIELAVYMVSAGLPQYTLHVQVCMCVCVHACACVCACNI